MKGKQFQLMEEWLKKAGDDELVIEDVLSSRHPVFNAVCFHAQQMAEKFLKSYLVYKDKEFPKIHQVDRL